jgi:hypothetical protein
MYWETVAVFDAPLWSITHDWELLASPFFWVHLATFEDPVCVMLQVGLASVPPGTAPGPTHSATF